MKNILEYYYHFANFSLHYKSGVYSFSKNNSLYLFKELTRSHQEFRLIYQLLLHYSSKYHKIILNKDKELFTVVDQKSYVLFQVISNSTLTITTEQFLKREQVIVPLKQFSFLYRTNWTDLWSQKIDYFEYQIKHIENKYPLLSSSIYYYIGLAENAISYVTDTKLHEKVEGQDEVCFSHIRMYSYVSVMDYYDPFSIILDHPSRDVAGYLKSLFFENSYTSEKIRVFLQELSFSKYGYRLLMGRLLYPSYYFDLYEQIILGIKEEKEMRDIIKRVEDYRDFMKMIYGYINDIVEIPSVDWL